MWNIKKERKKKRKEIKGKKSQIHGNRVELRVGFTKGRARSRSKGTKFQLQDE